jgi:spore maturation protein CgeB
MRTRPREETMTQGLSIAIFGSSLVSTYWNTPATYFRGLVRALSACGHRVTFYEPDAYGRQSHRDLDEPEGCRVVVYGHDAEAASAAVEDARGSDVVLKASGIGVHDALLERAVLGLQSPGTLVGFWDVDAPATLERLRHEPHDPLRDLIPRFDMVLTAGGGDPVVQAYRGLHAQLCVPIYNAVDPETHKPCDNDGRFAADLGLLANRVPDREPRVDEFFVRAAELAPGHRFLLGGGGWEGKALPPNVRHAGHVISGDHNAFNCAVRAVLNVSCESAARYGFTPPARFFEAAAAGACVITDVWEGIERFLEPGREILVARSGEEVADHLQRLTPERAREIGQAAQRRVLAEHTFAHRAAQLDRLLRNEASRFARVTRVGTSVATEVPTEAHA